jgi:hypothetical protein
MISNGADISIAKVTINSAFWSPDNNKIAYMTVLKIPTPPGKSRVVAMKLNSPIARAA